MNISDEAVEAQSTRNALRDAHQTDAKHRTTYTNAEGTTYEAMRASWSDKWLEVNSSLGQHFEIPIEDATAISAIITEASK